MKISRLIKPGLFVIACVCGAGAASGAPETSQAEIVRSILAGPESKIDFAQAKLAIDKLVDPSTDVDGTRRKLDAMTSAAAAFTGPKATDIAKLRAVRKYIYEAGPWNDYRAFKYDLADPLGLKMEHKTLSNYLSTHLGNCVSMPVLFLVLVDRMGVHVTLSTAPNHLFLKYVDDAQGTTLNIEATSGGNPARDTWIRQQFPMSDRAVASGVYLKTLSRREAVAAMAELVLEHDLLIGRYRDAVKVAAVILIEGVDQRLPQVGPIAGIERQTLE